MRSGWSEAAGRPTFARPFRPRADQRLTAGRRAWLARARARLEEDWACCDDDCLGELLERPGFRRSARAWQQAWARLSTYERQAALLDYFRSTGPPIRPEGRGDEGTRGRGIPSGWWWSCWLVVVLVVLVVLVLVLVVKAVGGSPEANGAGSGLRSRLRAHGLGLGLGLGARRDAAALDGGGFKPGV